MTYPIRAYLADYINNKKSHAYAYNVTIIEPPRIVPAETIGSKITNPKICCCCEQGTSRLDVKHSRNICRGGELISLNIHVDNKQCKKKV